MAKYNQAAHNPKRRRAPLGFFVAGAGLILLAIAFALLARPDEQAARAGDTAAGNTASAIPSPVNYAAPELTLNRVDGQSASLSDYRGQVVLVNNWATWCPPCRAEMPELEAFYRRHQDEGFTLIGISAGDSQAQVEAFIAEYGVTFPMWLDPDEQSMRAFQTEYLPSSFVIDRAGTVRLAWTGAISLEMLEAHVAPLLVE
ncbi:MAG: TlpA family protein disulfide reductase [Anaerolineales bacterium]|nr:TlpA family protein disulfide reductase [Anaerolineales bacterium]